MTDDSLPDDVRRWPDDPEELLGVSDEVDRKTLRRAYSRLIRRYKPDHFPEQFQRIRSAYESMLQMISWRERYASDDDDDESGDADGSDVVSDMLLRDDLLTGDDDGPSPWTASVSSNDSIADSHWQQAIDGQFSEAYSGLRKCYEQSLQQGRQSETIAVRLYWLLRVNPQLDAQRDAFDWLVCGVRNQLDYGVAWGLFQEEIRRDSAKILQPRCRELLTLSEMSIWLFIEMTELYLSSSAEQNEWGYFSELVQAAYQKTVRDDLEALTRVLFSALDYVCWNASPVAESIREDIHTKLTDVSHLEIEYGHLFDRYEWLDHLSTHWHEVNSGKLKSSLPVQKLSAVDRLLKDSWNGDYLVIRRQLSALIEPWVRHPEKGLLELSTLFERRTIAFGRLVELFEHFGGGYTFDTEDSERQQMLKEAVIHFVMQRSDVRARHNARRLLSQFCIKHAISLEAFELIYFENLSPAHEHFTEWVVEYVADEPLNCLLKAHRVFWSM